MPVTTTALLSVIGFLLIGKAPYIWLISTYCLIACANGGLQLQACRVRVQCKVYLQGTTTINRGALEYFSILVMMVTAAGYSWISFLCWPELPQQKIFRAYITISAYVTLRECSLMNAIKVCGSSVTAGWIVLCLLTLHHLLISLFAHKEMVRH